MLRALFIAVVLSFLELILLVAGEHESCLNKHLIALLIELAFMEQLSREKQAWDARQPKREMCKISEQIGIYDSRNISRFCKFSRLKSKCDFHLNFMWSARQAQFIY